MANQLLAAPTRALDANAYAMPGATMTVYASGTMTLIPVYSDVDGTVPTTNPVVADANGVFPQSFVTQDAKVIVRDAGGATLWTLDPCPATSGDATGASAIPFTPTVDVPETNVQAAIESVAASVLTGATDFGLGITGNAPTISNIDSTTQASGVYRFTGTTTGTFPGGITAATTGLVRIDRQTAAEAIMYLRAAGGSQYFVRHMSASVWGAWQLQIDNNTLVTSTETIAANNTDFGVPTSAAVVGYVGAVSLGINQTWQDVTGSRAAATTYQNTTARPIMVTISSAAAAGTSTISAGDSAGSLIIIDDHQSSQLHVRNLCAVIPAGWFYRYAGTISRWTELR